MECRDCGRRTGGSGNEGRTEQTVRPVKFVATFFAGAVRRGRSKRNFRSRRGCGGNTRSESCAWLRRNPLLLGIQVARVVSSILALTSNC